MKQLRHNKRKDKEDLVGGRVRSLILYDDDHHSFDYVISSLVEVCCHDTIQAIQCTYLVHFKKKCEIKTGSLELLKPMRDELVNRELKVKIK
jgi:ATP-dependent Clp protease adaptor protein ClpS